MSKIFYVSLAIVFLMSSCKLKEDSSTTPTDNNKNTTTTAITVTAPNGGEVLQEGSSYNITWTGTTSSLIRIAFSFDNGSTWYMVADSLSNTGTYSWFPVPNFISNQCLIRISVVDGSSSDVSDKVFSIIRNANESLRMISPNGGESWEAGTEKQIKWYSAGLDSVKIEYTVNNGNTWNLIAVDKKNTGIYYWKTIPNTPSTLAKVRISDAKDGDPSTESSNTFNILPEPIIVVTAPNGGERWSSGTNKTIEWTSENIENVKISYTINNGYSWNVITPSTLNIGYYEWNNIPNQNSKNCKIRIEDAVDGEPYDVSDNTFTLTSEISLELTIPNGGESWKAGSKHDLQWNSKGIDQVNLEYSINAGLTWNPIVSNLQNAGAYTWTVPSFSDNANITQCLIRISDASDKAIFDVSDYVFTITPQPSITVVSPNGGEKWYTDSRDNIRWTSANVRNVKIEYTTNGGEDWMTVIESTPSNGVYGWAIPPNHVSSALCKVRISDAADGSVWDASDNYFEILNSNDTSGVPIQLIQVTSPNGGEKWAAGSRQMITWNSSGIAKVKIEYTINNGISWITITDSTESDGFYTWDLIDPNKKPIVAVTSTNCKIRISDAKDGTPSDDSNQLFTIEPEPYVTIKEPNGGEYWLSGTSQDISWISENVADVKIEYSIDAGANWYTIVESTPSIGTYKWNSIPNLFSMQCRIRISDANDRWPYDISDNNFTISNQIVKSIQVLNPNGGENWEAGTKQNITWSASGVSSVKIELTTDKGSTWTTLANNITGGAWEWNISQSLNSTQCQIRVSDAGDPSVSDISNATFTISPRKYITVSQPKGPITFKDSDPVTITWESSGIQTVGIKYTTTNGIGRYPDIPEFYPLVDKIANQGSFTTSFSFPSDQYYVVVYNADEGSNGAPSARSIGNFTIVKTEIPTITVRSPNGGEQLLVSPTNVSTSDPDNYHPYEIRWNATGLEKVKIEWSTTGGGVWYTVPGADSTANDGIFTWAPGRLELSVGEPRPDSSDNCLIRVSNLSGSVSDRSDGFFSIHESKLIRVEFPNDEQYFTIDNADRYPMDIRWTSYAVSSVDIYVSIDNGVTWFQIVSNYKSTGAYEWDWANDPNVGTTTVSTLGRIKIADHSNGKIFDTNDAPFWLNKTQGQGY